MTDLQGRSLIGSQFGGTTGAEFRALDPATGERLQPAFHTAMPDEIDQAARLAEQAFEQYAHSSGATRANLLRRIAEGLETQADQLAQRMPQETGLPEARARGELARTCGQLRLFADVAEQGHWVDARIDHADPARQPQPKPDLRSMWLPLGPVAVFGASNFPLAFSVAGGDTAAALAAGCPVVVKAHSAHPGVSEIVGRVIQAAVQTEGLPEGVFSLLFGDGGTVGAALVQHPAMQAVGFTGSFNGGKALMELAAARPQPIPVYAEMGSLNPVVLLPGALDTRADELARGLAGSMTMGAGQFCTCPSLILAIDSPALDQFLQTLQTVLSDTQPGVMLNPGIARSYHAGIRMQTHLDGVEVRLGDTGEGCKASPALLVTDANNWCKQPLLREEVFGPSTLVVRCANPSALLQATAALEGQLTATLHGTADELAAWPALVNLLRRKAGRLLFGGFPTGVEVSHAMVHGGPFPASSDGRSTSVGSLAIHRFARVACYQNFPQNLLPATLQDHNPLGVWRLVDGHYHR
ncbi:aldehyde dehydrogenase (NADP(+)) [Chitinivorax sp. B]|uniref:aldehyde dehydrogenase (NADP(+)) n=1 Tax=Chitinivorax sp. B TaxID=2502235 RepID=UPI0010F66AE2|nr:aldehyde dehydrogenase (NADP(+)) [Chitinivorax sp. B]